MGIEWSWIFTMMVIITVMVDGGRERGRYFFNAVALKSDFFICVRFCQSNYPNITIANRKGLTILFTSDMEEIGGGAQCTAECIEGWTEATTLQSSGKCGQCKILSLQFLLLCLR